MRKQHSDSDAEACARAGGAAAVPEPVVTSTSATVATTQTTAVVRIIEQNRARRSSRQSLPPPIREHQQLSRLGRHHDFADSALIADHARRFRKDRIKERSRLGDRAQFRQPL
jgi:hypothetical protein